jgi:hypothetical protein
VGKVALEQIFLRVLRFSPVSISLLVLRVQLFIYYRRYIIPAVDSVLKITHTNTAAQVSKMSMQLVYIKGPWKMILPDTWVHTEMQPYCGFVLLCYDVV